MDGLFIIGNERCKGSEIKEGKTFLVGDLKIKDKVNSVEIPIEFHNVDNNLVLSGQISIDRTLWGVNYNSGSFFKNLGEAIIADDVLLTINIILNKK